MDSYPCHSCSSSAPTAFSACTLTAMPLSSANLTPFRSISKVLQKPASTQTNSYTNPLLHKHSFTPTRFTETRFSQKPAFTQTRFSTTNSSTNQLLTTTLCSNATAFYTYHLDAIPALGLKPKARGRRTAEGSFRGLFRCLVDGLHLFLGPAALAVGHSGELFDQAYVLWHSCPKG